MDLKTRSNRGVLLTRVMALIVRGLPPPLDRRLRAIPRHVQLMSQTSRILTADELAIYIQNPLQFVRDFCDIEEIATMRCEKK